METSSQEKSQWQISPTGPQTKQSIFVVAKTGRAQIRTFIAGSSGIILLKDADLHILGNLNVHEIMGLDPL